MADKLKELVAQFDAREARLQQVQTEQQLQQKLFEAQLAKAKIERAELNTEFTKERLEMHKQLLEASQQNEQLISKIAEGGKAEQVQTKAKKSMVQYYFSLVRATGRNRLRSGKRGKIP